MIGPEITLEAALRDVSSDREHYRHQAVRNLAPALLAELGQPGPRWNAAAEHPRGADVLAALRRQLDDHEPAPLRGLAALGLGTLGDASVWSVVEDWLDIEGDDDDRVYLRECAVIAASFVGHAAAQADAAPELRASIEARMMQALHAEAPDLRFQASLALAELQGAAAEPALVAALRRETDPEVREGLVDALAHLDPPGPEACELFGALLDGDEGRGPLGFLAAMALAGARQSKARPRLLQGLAVRHERDDALEALAALGRASTAEIEPVLRLARRVWLPGITRVRAAYALARMVPQGQGDDPGTAMLRRLRWHPRSAVREAVRDAFANLEQLAARDRAAAR